MLSVDTTVPSPIEVGAWSPTMDIIALALESEEVYFSDKLFFCPFGIDFLSLLLGDRLSILVLPPILSLSLCLSLSLSVSLALCLSLSLSLSP